MHIANLTLCGLVEYRHHFKPAHIYKFLSNSCKLNSCLSGYAISLKAAPHGRVFDAGRCVPSRWSRRDFDNVPFCDMFFYLTVTLGLSNTISKLVFNIQNETSAKIKIIS